MNLRLLFFHVSLASLATTIVYGVYGCSSSTSSSSNGSSQEGGAASGSSGGSGGSTSGASGGSSGTTGAASSGGSSSSASSSGSSGGAAGSSSGSDAGSSGSSSSGVQSHPGECIYPPTASERKAPNFTLPAPANPQGLILRLMNNCPLDLWVHAAGIPNGLVELKPKQAGQPPAEEVYDWPGLGGRISVNLDSATGFNINFLEMNAKKGVLNVNLSNVDWVGLPVEVRGNNPATCLTACYTPLADMMNGCPAALLDSTHHICQAPKDWCANAANQSDPICTSILPAATAVVTNDAKCSAGQGVNATAADVYGCGGKFWSASPYCCAEVNRGYKTDVNDPGKDMTQNCNYYQSEPYSDYSAYAQKVCPFVYAFAYDDFNNQSGFQTCQGATEMDITWCPADP